MRAELLKQWEANHDEHCGWQLPCERPEGCQWPKPALLGQINPAENVKREQQGKCLSGEHEAEEYRGAIDEGFYRPQGRVQQRLQKVCRHCRCLYVEKTL